jgi:hypothetical protein
MRRWATSGALLLMLVLRPLSGHAMDMKVEGESLFLSGAVVRSDCDSFDTFVKQKPIKRAIFGSSPGGDVASGYCVGSHIRTLGIATVIQTACSSACSLMWLGGVERTLANSKSRVGMHGVGSELGTSDGTRGGELYVYVSNMAPKVDRKLLDEWVHFKSLSLIMVFYNDKAELCRGKGLGCTPIPGRNALNVGLTTK